MARYRQTASPPERTKTPSLPAGISAVLPRDPDAGRTNHLFGLSRQQSDGRHTVPHPKLDDRCCLTCQFPQLVTVLVDVGLRAAGLLKQLIES